MTGMAALLHYAVKKKNLRVLEGVCCSMNHRDLQNLAEEAKVDTEELEELLREIS